MPVCAIGDTMVNDALFSSACTEWGTPQALFDELDSEFHFTLDPCANEQNHKCAKYYTEAENGLLQVVWNDFDGYLKRAEVRFIRGD